MTIAVTAGKLMNNADAQRLRVLILESSAVRGLELELLLQHTIVERLEIIQMIHLAEALRALQADERIVLIIDADTAYDPAQRAQLGAFADRLFWLSDDPPNSPTFGHWLQRPVGAALSLLLAAHLELNLKR